MDPVRRTTSLLAAGLALTACSSASPAAAPTAARTPAPAGTATSAGSPTRAPASPTDPASWPLPVSDAACPDGDTSLADFIDFVEIGSRSYGGVSEGRPSTARLGRTILTTRCRYGDGAPDDGYEQRSGDASYLPVGTAVRELVGFDAGFRVAAEVDGAVRLFQADPPPRAGTGADVYPGLAEHVTAVHLTSQQDATTVLARIGDPARVRSLVQQLLAAPYSPKAGFGDADSFLSLRLDDGTALRSAYNAEKGLLVAGIAPPPAFGAELRRALATSEGQPTPRCLRVPGDVSRPSDAEDYVGLTEVAAQEQARREGLVLRVSGRDGACTDAGRPSSATRVNVDVRDGVVRDAARY